MADEPTKRVLPGFLQAMIDKGIDPLAAHKAKESAENKIAWHTPAKPASIATNVPLVINVEHYAIFNSSFAMMDKKPKGRKKGKVIMMPFALLECGQSFMVPLTKGDSMIRVRMSQATKALNREFKLIVTEQGYEVGRIS